MKGIKKSAKDVLRWEGTLTMLSDAGTTRCVGIPTMDSYSVSDVILLAPVVLTMTLWDSLHGSKKNTPNDTTT